MCEQNMENAPQKVENNVGCTIYLYTPTHLWYSGIDIPLYVDISFVNVHSLYA